MVDVECIIVGGGMAGLSAALHLEGRDILLLESSDRVGGRVRSAVRGPYWANLGAQFVAPQGALGRIARLPGIELLPASGHPHLSVNGSLTKASPLSLMMSRGLGIRSRAGLAAFSLRCDRDFRRMNRKGEAARAFRRALDEQDADSLFRATEHTRPVLDAISQSVMSAELSAVSGAHATAYFHFAMAVGDAMSDYSFARNGSETLVAAVHDTLSATTRIHTKSVVRRVSPRANHVEVEYERDGAVHTTTAKRCVMAAPAYVAHEVLEGIPSNYTDALKAVKVGSYLVAGVFTTESGPRPWDTIPNMTIVGRSFQALFNPVSAMRAGPRLPGGSLSIYAGGKPARDLMDASDAEVGARFSSDLCEILPLDHDEISEVVIQRWPKAMPYWGGGSFAGIESVRTPVNRIHFAGDYMSRPAMTTAADAGAVAAKQIAMALLDA